MSHVEFVSWLAYRAKYGSLDVVRRCDRPAALIADTLSRTTWGREYKGDLGSFMPWPKLPVLSEAERFARELMGNG